MNSEDIILHRIVSEKEFNFGDLLFSESPDLASLEHGNKILNTLELFAFGGCTDYAQDRSLFVDLPTKGLRKLITLSILSVLNANVGNTIDYSEVSTEISPFIQNTHELESTLIALIDAQVIDVRINEENRSIRVIGTSVTRDAYNKNKYRLRVLQQNQLKVMPVGQARNILQNWLSECIVPTSQEFVSAPAT